MKTMSVPINALDTAPHEISADVNDNGNFYLHVSLMIDVCTKSWYSCLGVACASLAPHLVTYKYIRTKLLFIYGVCIRTLSFALQERGQICGALILSASDVIALL